MSCILNRAASPDDSQQIAIAKKIIVCGTLTGTISAVLIMSDGRFRLCIGYVPLVLVFIRLMITKQISLLSLEFVLYAYGLYYLLADLSAIALGIGRSWSSFIVLIDIALVCRLPPRVTKILTAVVILWVTFITVERSARFGLFDSRFFLFELPEQDTRRETYCDCDTLPCPIPWIQSLYVGVGQIIIFLLDFYFTRSFAEALHAEKESMKSVITAAEHIASCLSRLDLESAEQAIEGSSLPPPLHTAFSDILANLRIYIPYLPQSCFPENVGGSESSEDSINISGTAGTGTPPINTPTLDKGHRRSGSFCSSLMSIDKLPTTIEKRVSYLVVNLLETHKAISDHAAFCHTFSDFVQKVLRSVKSHNGVVGIVLGDHIHSYFNATKRCASYAQAAVETAVMLHPELSSGDMITTMSIATGAAHCGSFGCAELMSIAVIGRVAVQASQLERLCRKENLSIVTSGTVYSEVSHAFRLRIVLALLTMQEGYHVVAYEVLSEQAVKEKDDDEWMYQLDENPWEAYNEAGKHFLMGNTEESLRLLAIPFTGSDEVAEHIQMLKMLHIDTLPSGAKPAARNVERRETNNEVTPILGFAGVQKSLNSVGTSLYTTDEE